jgi:hypothetical protein
MGAGGTVMITLTGGTSVTDVRYHHNICVPEAGLAR